VIGNEGTPVTGTQVNSFGTNLRRTSGITFEQTPVPEPVALLGIGLAGLAGVEVSISLI